MADPEIDLSVVNLELSPPDAVVISDEEATLAVTLTNHTGAAISLTPADSRLLLIMPDFLVAGMADMKFQSLPSGWSASDPLKDGSTHYFLLTYTEDQAGKEEQAGEWADEADITFTIAHVRTEQPTAVEGKLSLQLDGIHDNELLTTDLSLEVPPPDLHDALAVTLINPYVFISPDGDSIENTLRLNFQNIRQDGQPLYAGDEAAGKPLVKVYFKYGEGENDLTNEKSAREIKARQVDAGDIVWETTDPSDGSTDIYWLLEPSDPRIIGADGNVTIEFSHIVPNGATGNPNMYVEISGFLKDDGQPNKTQTLELQFHKAQLPATGLISLDVVADNLASFSWDDPRLEVRFYWLAMGVSEIQITSPLDPDVPLLERQYDPVPPLLNDDYKLSVDLTPIIKKSITEALEFTITALHSEGPLSSQSCTLPLPPAEATFDVQPALGQNQLLFNPRISVHINPFQDVISAHLKVDGEGPYNIKDSGEKDGDGRWLLDCDYESLQKNVDGDWPDLAYDQEHQLTLYTDIANVGANSIEKGILKALVVGDGKTVSLDAGSHTYSLVQINKGGNLQINMVTAIECDYLILEQDGKINGIGSGYHRQSGPGCPPLTSGNASVAGGAGHAGEGGGIGESLPGGPPYGDEWSPTSPGSGGGGQGYASFVGSGGAALRVVAHGSVLLDGTIGCDGADGEYGSGAHDFGGGGGSGGSLWITAGQIRGTGQLGVTGGGSDGYAGSGGGGSGGMILIESEDHHDFHPVIKKDGGFEDGSPGTYHLIEDPHPPQLVHWSWQASPEDIWSIASQEGSALVAVSINPHWVFEPTMLQSAYGSLKWSVGVCFNGRQIQAVVKLVEMTSGKFSVSSKWGAKINVGSAEESVAYSNIYNTNFGDGKMIVRFNG